VPLNLAACPKPCDEVRDLAFRLFPDLRAGGFVKAIRVRLVRVMIEQEKLREKMGGLLFGCDRVLRRARRWA